MIPAKPAAKSSLYSSVTSVLNTGSSVTNYEKRKQAIHKDIKYKPNELFKRIRPETLGRKILEASEHFDLQQIDRECFGAVNIGSCLSTPYPYGDLEYRVRSLAATVQGTPRYSRSREGTAPAAEGEFRRNINGKLVGLSEDECQEDAVVRVPAPKTLSYLILDTRSSDEYKACHIITARHYPSAMMSKASNQLTREIYEYRNRPDKIIIVYDNDESIAPTVATFFAERGIENVYLLSGGLYLLQERVHGIILGNVDALLKNRPATATPKAQIPGRSRAPGRKIPGVTRPQKVDSPKKLPQPLPAQFVAGNDGAFDLKELSSSLDAYAELIKRR